MAHITKPTVFLVHGAWHDPIHIRPVRELFESRGCLTMCFRQPSFSAQPPVATMDEDAICVRSQLSRIVEDEHREVIVVMHSYGEVVGSEATHKSFGKSARESKRLIGGVLRLLYMCAFVLPLGRFAGIGVRWRATTPSPLQESDGICNMQDPRRCFYNNLSGEAQDY